MRRDCGCGGVITNVVERIKWYGSEMQNCHKNRNDYICENEDMDWYKQMMRDFMNDEKHLRKSVENYHKEYCLA